MKKEKVAIFFSIVILLSGLLFFILIKQNNKYDYIIETIETKNCDSKAKLYHELEGNIKVYTYCLDNIKINNSSESIELKDEIIKDSNIIQSIISNLELNDILFDGGTAIYRDSEKTKFTKSGLTIISCSTLSGNKDIYIGNKNMKFKQNFCQNNNYTFIRTYTVKDVFEYNEQQYKDGVPVSYGNSFKVILSEFQGKTETVIINNLWDMKLEKNKSYEFEFMLNEDATNIQDDIEYIFNNSIIIEVRETNKNGLDQIHDMIN